MESIGLVIFIVRHPQLRSRHRVSSRTVHPSLLRSAVFRSPYITMARPSPSCGDVALDCEGNYVHDIIAIPNTNLLVVEGKHVFVYSAVGSTTPVMYFRKHKYYVTAVVHLSDNVVASVDMSGYVFTWDASSGDSLGFSNLLLIVNPY